MKVLFISPFPPGKEGIGQYTQRVTQDSEAIGIDVSVIAFADKGKSFDGNIYRVFSGNLGSIKATWQAIKKVNPDIIHVQFAVATFRLSSFILWPLLQFYKKSHSTVIVATLHEPQRDIIALGLLGRIFYRSICNTCDEIYTLTDDSRLFLIEKCGTSNLKIKTIHHGVYNFKDTHDNSQQLRKKFGIGDSKKVILFFGFIHIDKGIEYLIEAFVKLIRTNSEPPYILVIAGVVRPRKGIFKIFQKIDERYEKKIKGLIAKYDIEQRVVFTGYIPNEDIYSTFKLAEVVVLPYPKTEQSGVLNMALACERPIIATAVGGFKDILAEAGVLVPPRNPDALADALETILNDKNAHLKKHLIEAYKEIRSKQKSDVISREQFQFYQKLLPG